MLRQQPGSTGTDTLFPDPTLVRAWTVRRSPPGVAASAAETLDVATAGAPSMMPMQAANAKALFRSIRSSSPKDARGLAICRAAVQKKPSETVNDLCTLQFSRNVL